MKPKTKKKTDHPNPQENYEEIITKIFQNSKKTKLSSNDEESKTPIIKHNQVSKKLENPLNHVEAIVLTKNIHVDRRYHTNSNTLDTCEENKKIVDKSVLNENVTEPQNEHKANRLSIGESRYERDENISNNFKNEVNAPKTFYKESNTQSNINSLKNKSIKDINYTSEQTNCNVVNNTSSSNKLNTKNRIILHKVNTSSIDMTQEQNKQNVYPELKTEATIPRKKNSLENNGYEYLKNHNSAVKSKINQTREKQEKFNDKFEKTPEIKKQNTKISKNFNSDSAKGNTKSIGKSCEKRSSIIGFLMNKHSNDFKPGSKNLNEKINLDAFSNSKLEIVTKIYSSNTANTSKKNSLNNVIIIQDHQNSSKLKSQLEKNKNILRKNIELNLNKRNVSTAIEKSQNSTCKKSYTTNINQGGKRNLNLAKIHIQKTFELNLNLDSPDYKTLKSNIKSTTENVTLNDSSWSLNSSNNVINEIIKIKKSSIEDPGFFLDKSNSQKNVIFLSNLDSNTSSPNTHKPKNLNKNFLVPTVRTNLYDENEQSGIDCSSNSLSENNSCSLLQDRNMKKRNTERSESLRRKLSDARDKKHLQKQNSGMIETVNKISSNIFNKINDELNEIRNNLSVKSKISNDSQNLKREEYYSENCDNNNEDINEKCVLSPELENCNKNYFSNNSAFVEEKFVAKIRNRFMLESQENKK